MIKTRKRGESIVFFSCPCVLHDTGAQVDEVDASLPESAVISSSGRGWQGVVGDYKSLLCREGGEGGC